MRQLTYSFWMSLFELQLHLFTQHWGCQWYARVCVCVSLYVLWVLQQTHLVAMCQCHWPLCSPSGWYTHSASSDSCSIRGPTHTRTHTHEAWSIVKGPMCILTQTHKKAWKWIPQLSQALHILITFQCCLQSQRLQSGQISFKLKNVCPSFFICQDKEKNLLAEYSKYTMHR